MRCIYKKSMILKDNSGETMAEVLVAFTLLSIMLVIFAEGLAWATRTEVRASNTRQNADQAMKNVQTILANGGGTTGPVTGLQDPLNGRLRRGTYTYTSDDGKTELTYTYYVPVVLGG